MAGRFSAPPPFVGLLSHKLFRLVLKSRIFPFNPFWLAEALKNYILWTLDLLKHSFIFFTLAFGIDIFLYVFCIVGHFALFGV